MDESRRRARVASLRPATITAPRRVAALLAVLAVLLLTACGQTRVTAVDQLLRRPADPTAKMQQALLAYNQAVVSTEQQRVLDAAANWYLARMSLSDQLAQMLMNRCACDPGKYTPDLATMVEQQHIGGIIFYADNFGGSFSQTQSLLSTVQSNASIPLFMATDQEGGPVNRIAKYFGDFPSARQLGDSNNPGWAFADGQQIAQDMQQLGLNTDIAPDVDVPVDGGGIWGTWRSFSYDPKQVVRIAGAYLSGVQSTGVIGTLKHFPGIGGATQDPHATLPVILRSLTQFRQTELYPYQALMSSQPGMIMTTDVLVPSVDSVYPTELSPTWVDGILRHQLGYDGVVTTDAIWMNGITDHWSVPEASVLAVIAGNDIIEGAGSAAESQAILDALSNAVASGQISQQRIAQSVRRILRLKIRYGMLPIPPQLYSSMQLVHP